jgi:segregation and condensation protein B
VNVTTNGHRHRFGGHRPAQSLGRHDAHPDPLADQLDMLPPPEADSLPSVIESLLFVATEPVEVGTLAQSLRVRRSILERALEVLGDRLKATGLRLQRSLSSVQLVTAPESSQHVERFLGVAAEQPLSSAALETLAIIAYKQPVTRAMIEAIRGVNAERAIATLRSRALVEDVGRSESVGRPILFGTTMQFLEHFGLESLGQLPPLPEPIEA